jgi:hypothetical protein
LPAGLSAGALAEAEALAKAGVPYRHASGSATRVVTMLRLCVTVLAVLSLATLHANQEGAPSAGTPSPADLDQIVTRVLASNATYLQTFRNLVAEETKDIQQIDGSGRVKRRTIVSDLVVYQPTRGEAPPVEYRDVRAVDGKPIAKRSERALDVIQRAMRAESLKRELEVIDRENQRYDLNFRITEATINQGALGPQFRSDYLVEWVGREQVDGHDVVVLDYRAKTTKPEKNGFIANLGATAIAPRGRLWADAASFQLRRDRFELVAFNSNLPEPLIFLRRDTTYRESRFGILTPQRIVGEWFNRTGGTRQKPSLARVALLTYTYVAFRRFEVATEDSITLPTR